VDPEKGGKTSLDRLTAECGPFPETVEALTGGGGRHLLFAHPGNGLNIRPNAGALGDGLDVRADDAYIVASPSSHNTGRLYAWEVEHHPDEVSLAPPPTWLLARLLDAQRSDNGDNRRPPEEWAELLRGAPLGKRHAIAARIAGHYLGLGVAPAEVEEILLGFTARCSPPFDEAEARRIVRDLAAKDTRKATVEGASGDGLALVSVGALLGEPDSAPPWLVEDRLPAGGLSLLAGKPKAGKSTLARCLALKVARGEPWLGFATLRGPVFYLALEEKREEVREHFRALGATSADPIYVLSTAAPADALARLRVEILRRRPVLIIVDPLFKFIRVPAKSGDDYATMTALLEPLLRLARETGAHVLAVHHLGKGARDDGDAILGSTAIFAAVDTALLLKRSERYRTLSSIQRYGGDLEEITLGLDSETRDVTAGPPRQEAEEAEAARLILAALEGASEPLTEPELLAEVEARTRATRGALRALVKSGKVTRTGRGTKGDPFRYAITGNENAWRERESAAGVVR